jgi:hypothetical protein
VSARLRMRGSIKVGPWLPFRASQVHSPPWARMGRTAAGVITRSDRYLDGTGLHRKLGGLVTFAQLDRAVGGSVGYELSAGGRPAAPTADRPPHAPRPTARRQTRPLRDNPWAT